MITRADGDSMAEVVPMGRVAPLATAVVAAHLQTMLLLPARVADVREIPRLANLRQRGQVDASRLLEDLQQDLAPRRLRIGVTGSDLCLPILTYVYGEALVAGRVAVVSTARLAVNASGDPPESARSLERLAKVALHEAAHALGLPHCRQSGCLMMFSAGLARLDRLVLRFCPACAHAMMSWRQRLAR